VKNDPVISVSIQPEGSPTVQLLDVSDQVIDMEYQDVEYKADKLTLTVDNSDLSQFDDPIWRKGNIIIISWGYSESMSIPRRCQIRKVQGFKQLRVEALGKEIELNVDTKTNVFEHTKRSEVVRYIANQWGFRDESLLHIQDTEVTREHIVQARMTDAQFMRRLAAKEGFEWYIDHDGFHFHERNFFQRSNRVLTYFSDPELTEITDITVETDVTKRAGTVRVKSHNPTKRRTIDKLADSESEKDRAVLGHVNEAPGKPEAKIPGYKSIAHSTIKGTTEPDDAAAKRAASAHFRNHQQGAVKINITLIGDPNIHAKSIIELRGVGKRLSGLYYVRGTSHKINSSYTLSLECVSDGSGGHSTKSRLAPEASAVQVGPNNPGKKNHTKGPHRGIDKPGEADKPAALSPTANKDGSTSYTKGVKNYGGQLGGAPDPDEATGDD
jgi:phage protein D